MAGNLKKAVQEAVSPLDRVMETMFGVLMTMSITASTQVGSAEAPTVRALLVAALGCNLAWGIVDAVMFLVRTDAVRGRNRMLIERMKAATSLDAFKGALSEAIAPGVAARLDTQDFESVRRKVHALPDDHLATRNGRVEWMAALFICALVFLSTLPLAVPFIVIDDPRTALRTSHAVAIAMLFILGWKLADWSGRSAARSGVSFAALGLVLAGLCVALGG